MIILLWSFSYKKCCAAENRKEISYFFHRTYFREEWEANDLISCSWQHQEEKKGGFPYMAVDPMLHGTLVVCCSFVFLLLFFLLHLRRNGGPKPARFLSLSIYFLLLPLSLSLNYWSSSLPARVSCSVQQMSQV